MTNSIGTRPRGLAHLGGLLIVGIVSGCVTYSGAGDKTPSSEAPRVRSEQLALAPAPTPTATPTPTPMWTPDPNPTAKPKATRKAQATPKPKANRKPKATRKPKPQRRRSRETGPELNPYWDEEKCDKTYKIIERELPWDFDYVEWGYRRSMYCDFVIE